MESNHRHAVYKTAALPSELLMLELDAAANVFGVSASPVHNNASQTLESVQTGAESGYHPI